MSEPLEPVIFQASLSKPQYEPVYSIHPPLKEDPNRARHQSQNQNTLEINRQNIHPGRNRNLQTPRAQFNILQSPITNPIDLSSKTIQSTPRTPKQPNTSTIPIVFVGATPTSEQIRKNPFNPPATIEHLPFWMTQAFTQGEANLVNDPIDVSSDTSLSLPSTPSLTQISQTPFPPNFSYKS